MSNTHLQRLLTPPNYQAARQNVFPSQTSLQWFIRTNRRNLIDSGALVTIAGRNLIVEEAFDATVLAIGRAKATGA